MTAIEGSRRVWTYFLLFMSSFPATQQLTGYYEINYLPIRDLLNKSEAEHLCRTRYGGFLPWTYSVFDYSELDTTMNQGYIPEVWLGVVKKKYHKTQWVKSSITVDLRQSKENDQCCYLFEQSQSAQLTSCNKTFGALCKINNCSVCIKGPSRCYTENNSCYEMHCESYTWMEARRLCQLEGGDLAVFPDINQSITQACKQIEKRPHARKSCDQFWLGASRFSWVHQGGNDYVAYKQLVNDMSNKGNLEGECAYYTGGSNPGWVPESCSKKHHVVCVTVKSAKKPNSLILPTKNTPFKNTNIVTPELVSTYSEKSLIVSLKEEAWIWGWILVLVLIISIIIGFCCFKHAKKKECGGTGDENENLKQDMYNP